MSTRHTCSKTYPRIHYLWIACLAACVAAFASIEKAEAKTPLEETTGKGIVWTTAPTPGGGGDTMQVSQPPTKVKVEATINGEPTDAYLWSPGSSGAYDEMQAAVFDPEGYQAATDPTTFGHVEMSEDGTLGDETTKGLQQPEFYDSGQPVITMGGEAKTGYPSGHTESGAAKFSSGSSGGETDMGPHCAQTPTAFIPGGAL